MKRIILILVSLLLISSSVFSEINLSSAGDNASVKLKGVIQEESYTSTLLYGGVNVYDGDVVNEDAIFDLTVDRRSKKFALLFSSNYIKTTRIQVLVSCSDFTRDAGQEEINPESGNQKISLATRLKRYPANGRIRIPNGLIKNKKLEDFRIAWTPNSTLAAGSYTSIVTVKYVAN